MADQDYYPSSYDGEEWAEGHFYGVWRPPVIRGKAGRVPEEDRIVSEVGCVDIEVSEGSDDG